MKKSRFFILFIIIFLYSCKDKKASKAIITKDVPKQFEMYKTSEMAALMRLMLAENEQLKQKILKGEDIGIFNKEYYKIQTAVMTDESDRQGVYPALAANFLATQKKIYTVSSKEDLIKKYNTAIQSCIACHEQRCGGLIERIQKILISEK